MDLHQIAENDLGRTLEGNGQTVTLTDPTGSSAEFQGISNDIGLMIDPDTGVPVSGRNINIALRIGTLRAAGFDLPKGVEDGSQSPWLVAYTTTNGNNIIGKVISSMPDRALGVITLRLELAE